MQLRDKLGICQWFHFEAFDELHMTLKVLDELNVKHFRTGISWADYLRPGGPEWYDYQMAALTEAGLEVLLSVWHTPPSLAEAPRCACPPRRLRDYADFIDQLISDYGKAFSALEIWNEPNNRLKWDFENHDPDWKKFSEMVGGAAFWARKRHVKTVLGGMIPVDPHWLQLVADHGALQHMEVVAIHGFPEMWWEDRPNWEWYHHWKGWEDKLDAVSKLAGSRPLWITETGLATWDAISESYGREDLQVEMLTQAAQASAERIYWYSTIDLNPDWEAIEGFHVDENEYHLGLVTYGGRRKPAYYAFQNLMQQTVSHHVSSTNQPQRLPRRLLSPNLLTGFLRSSSSNCDGVKANFSFLPL